MTHRSPCRELAAGRAVEARPRTGSSWRPSPRLRWRPGEHGPESRIAIRVCHHCSGGPCRGRADARRRILDHLDDGTARRRCERRIAAITRCVSTGHPQRRRETHPSSIGGSTHRPSASCGHSVWLPFSVTLFIVPRPRALPAARAIGRRFAARGRPSLAVLGVLMFRRRPVATSIARTSSYTRESGPADAVARVDRGEVRADSRPHDEDVSSGSVPATSTARSRRRSGVRGIALDRPETR